LPKELGGEVGECTECGAIFEIPIVDEDFASQSPDETSSDNEVNKSDTGVFKASEIQADEGTNTVKLSRTSIGMVPDVKDNFSFDVVKQPTKTGEVNPNRRTQGISNTKKSFKKPTSPPSRTQASRSRIQRKPQKKWWQFWMFWK
jgi:hypothetical protein